MLGVSVGEVCDFSDRCSAEFQRERVGKRLIRVRASSGPNAIAGRFALRNEVVGDLEVVGCDVFAISGLNGVR
jgi:hypothetical protein